MTEPITQTAVAAHIAVGHTSPVELATPSSGASGGGHLLVRNVGTKNVYVGGSGVKVEPGAGEEGGFLIKPEDPPQRISVPARGRLYAICGGTDTSEVHIIRS